MTGTKALVKVEDLLPQNWQERSLVSYKVEPGDIAVSKSQMSGLVKSDPIVAEAFVVHLLNEALKMIPSSIGEATELRSISQMLMQEYWYLKTEDFIRCIKMGIMGRLVDADGKPIKVYGSLSAKDFFEWFTAYSRMSARELDSLRETKRHEDSKQKLPEEAILKLTEGISTPEYRKETESNLTLLSHINRWKDESRETRKEREKEEKKKQKEK